MVEIISQRHVPVPVAKALLEKHLPNYMENPILAKVYEYLSRFSKCGPEEAEKAMEELVGAGFSSLAAAMLVNLVPRSVDEAKALLGNINGGYEDDKVEAAVELLNKYCKEEGA